jgi:hypothetical protein
VSGYLARYVFRVAITESRIVRLDDDRVTVRHKHRASGRWHTTRLNGMIRWKAPRRDSPQMKVSTSSSTALRPSCCSRLVVAQIGRISPAA